MQTGILIEPDKVYSAGECAKLFRVSRQTFSRYCRSGFPIRSVGGGMAIGSEIVQWIKSQPVKQRK